MLEQNGDSERLAQLFEELGFRSNQINASPPRKSTHEDKSETTSSNSNYQTIFDEKGLKEWSKLLDESTHFAIDTETNSLDTITAELVGISLAVEEGSGCYIPIGHAYDNCPQQLSLKQVQTIIGKAIERNATKAVGQNLKFDMPILRRHGICLLYTSPSPRDGLLSRMPSSA